MELFIRNTELQNLSLLYKAPEVSALVDGIEERAP